MSNSSSTSQQRIRLKDGRFLGYAEYGDRQGRPVLYFPGTPSSRLLHPPEEITILAGARLIVVERPGYGLSDFQRGRRLIDWPWDVISLADALGIDLFPVVGVSGGGPYAAVCACLAPSRVTKAAIVSGVGPTDLKGSTKEMPRIRRAGAAVARNAPWLLGAILFLVANPHHNQERFFRKMTSGNSMVDLEILSRPEIKEMLMANYLEATRNGMQGFAQDAIILSNPWGFRLEDISIPVDVWHGEKDANVSISAARYLAQAIPNCQVTFLSGEGHWLFMEKWGEILRSVLS